LRRAELDRAVAEVFEASGGRYGSPRAHDELLELGWKVSEKTVAASMAAQGLVARPKRRYRGLTRPDKAAKPADSGGFRTAVPDVFVHRFWRFSYTPREAGEHPRLS
jgi:transposase InsO family protein